MKVKKRPTIAMGRLLIDADTAPASDSGKLVNNGCRGQLWGNKACLTAFLKRIALSTRVPLA